MDRNGKNRSSKWDMGYHGKWDIVRMDFINNNLMTKWNMAMDQTYEHIPHFEGLDIHVPTIWGEQKGARVTKIAV